MKRVLLLLATLIAGFSFFTTPVQAANTNNFIISDYTVHYYLSRDEQGISHLKTTEDITAIFPDYDQNHGLTRFIPATNQAGANVTLPNLSSLSVTRNGQPEPIAQTEKSRDGYTLYLGDADFYVHGEQQYHLEYEFTKVITESDALQTSWQELYWDAAETQSLQFQQVSVYLHLATDLQPAVWEETPSCYVGFYGTTNDERCTVTATADGYLFSASDLTTYEQLTLAVRFNANTFVVPAPSKNYLLVALFIITCLSGLTLIILIAKKRLQIQPKVRAHQDAFLAPQYTPLKQYTVAELNAIALSPRASTEAATILELAVNHQIEIIKSDQKLFSNKWSIKVTNDNKLSDEQAYLLKLLNGGTKPTKGTTFELKSRQSTDLSSLLRQYRNAPTKSLQQKGDLTETPKGHYRLAGFATLWAFLISGLTIGLTAYLEDHPGGLVILEDRAIFYILAIVVLVIAIFAKCQSTITKYTVRTTQGLEHANYLAGLELYIKMAEKDRLNFLQSVKGADTSDKGIVKLYEKLLPYAALFGLEKSWANELARYYEDHPELSPVWYAGVGAFSARDFNTAMRGITTSVHSSTAFASSSSSGGGGGGFSGGGGGGGSIGGW